MSNETVGRVVESEGVELLSQQLDHSEIEGWMQSIQHCYDEIEATRSSRSVNALPQRLLRERFVPTASSFPLNAVLGDACVTAIVRHIARCAVGTQIVSRLGDAAMCALDQAWVRRQYAPAHYPAFHAPHGWHQDGALGFDFVEMGAKPPPEDALLPMVTCWFPLGACGDDAPGLEFVLRHHRHLVPVNGLTEAVVRRAYPPEAFWTPTLDAGDVLLFRGDILHRTHVTPEMTRDRTSIELRFVPASRIPLRLAGDHFVPLS